MMLSRLRIGSRLALSFTIIILLSIFSTALALYQSNANMKATRAMLDLPLAKERLLSDWRSATAVSVSRARIIAASSDLTLSAQFADETKANSQKISEFAKSIEARLETDEERALYKQTGEARAQYIKAREALYALKKSQAEAAGIKKSFDEDFVPKAKAYHALVDELVEFERKSIQKTTLELEVAAQKSFYLVVGLSTLLVIFSASLGFMISRSITRPLKSAVSIAARVADGDLTTSFRSAPEDEFGDLLRSLEKMNHSLQNMASQMQEGSRFISLASSEIAAGNLDLSSRTERQAASLEETASSMEELTAAVKNNADNAREAHTLSMAASKVATDGGAMMLEVTSSMKVIDASSRKIGDIISVIDTIAFQTNILALNAAVEAARAGEQGRGFAVVASEVRGLAGRSAAAAKEIKTLIENSAVQVNEGTRRVEQAGTIISNIVQQVKLVTDRMEEITQASHEQSEGIHQVNQSIGHMDQTTQQNAALVEESASAAENLKQQAEQLAQLSARFKLPA